MSASSTTDTRRELASWLIKHTREFLTPISVSILARIVGQLLGVAIFVVAVQAIHDAFTGQPVSVPSLVWALVGLSLAKAGLRYLEHYAGHWVAFTSLQRLRELFFARLIPQTPAAVTGKAGSSLTAMATRDIDQIEVFFAHTFPPVVSAIVVPIVAIIWLGVTHDPALALVLPGFIVLASFILPWGFSRFTWAATNSVMRQRAEVAEHVGDDIQGIREVLAFDVGSQRIAQLRDVDRVLTTHRCRVGTFQGVRAALIVLTQLMSLLVVLVVAQPDGSLLDLIVTLAVAVALWGPASGIDDFMTSLDTAFAATARLRSVVDAEPEVTPNPNAAGQLAIGDVAFDAVSFAYPSRPKAHVINDVSFTVAEGSWSYLVGVSGSGKSTLGALILRGWDAQSGAIRIGDQPITDVSLDELRSQVAVVPQRPVFLTRTIDENLRLARPDASAEDVAAALSVAGLTGWINSLPDGTQTQLQAAGGNVSGGQLQRLALARALVGNPRILILDEALSQLDSTTAVQVRDRLHDVLTAQPGRTIIEITHRVDLIPDTAHVVVLDNGRVMESGTPASLTQHHGAFTQLLART